MRHHTLKRSIFLCWITLAASSVPAGAQGLLAHDDSYGVPLGDTLFVEAFGVLDNDTVDGEPAGETGATAMLVTDVSNGSLVLNPDGSFTYDAGPTFDGLDGFVYRAISGADSADATVTLTACTGGPDVFACWKETAFLVKVTALGHGSYQEGFEDDLTWASSRSPDTIGSVVSQGIRWQSNHPDPPASNHITTGSGPARTGAWGIYDPEHGYASGVATQCDIDNPPDSCLFHDGITGTREPGLSPLHGVGGYFTGTFGANVAIILDGDEVNPIAGGTLTGGEHKFFGVIDARPAGFSRFEFREQDGKIGQQLFIWGDDFTLVGAGTTDVPGSIPTNSIALLAQNEPNPFTASTTIRFSLAVSERVTLKIYDLSGREVATLIDGERRPPGVHRVEFRPVGLSSGVYLCRLQAGHAAEARKMIVFR